MTNLKNRTLRAAIGLLAVPGWVLAIGVTAQAQTATAALSLQGQTCPEGRYEGRPTPGKTSYIKDPYVWAVTREFAQRFCMPEEFVVDDLKGAHAIAYWHGKPTGKEVCEIQDGQEVCQPTRHGHWLEIYVKNGAIPKYDPEVGFYVREYASSGDLVRTQQNLRNVNARDKGTYIDPAGKRRPYYGLGKAANGKRITFHYLARTASTQVDERPAALLEHYYLQNWYEGIDLIALEAWSWGAIAGKDYSNAPQYGYAIGITKEAVAARTLSYPEGFLHVIELPQRIVQVLNAADRGGGKAFEQAVRNLGSSVKQPAR